MPEMNDNKQLQDAVSCGIRLLGMRAHGRSELSSKLRKKGYVSTTVDAAIARLESLGLVDDRAFAAGWVESLSKRRPEGKAKARMRLLQKGIPEELTEEALREYDSPAMCCAAAEKKMRSLTGTPETKRKKLETFLRNRGFDWESIKQAVAQATGGRGLDEFDRSDGSQESD